WGTCQFREGNLELVVTVWPWRLVGLPKLHRTPGITGPVNDKSALASGSLHRNGRPVATVFACRIHCKIDCSMQVLTITVGVATHHRCFVYRVWPGHLFKQRRQVKHALC